MTETTPLLSELTRVRVTRDLLPAGTVGTIVHVYASGEAYIVEFPGKGLVSVELNCVETVDD